MISDHGYQDVRTSSQDDSVSSEPRVWHLGDHGVASGTERELESQVDDDHHTSNTGSDIGTADDTEDTDNDLSDTDSGSTEKIESPSVEPTHEIDGGTGGKDVDRLDSHRVVESHSFDHPGVSQATCQYLCVICCE